MVTTSRLNPKARLEVQRLWPQVWGLAAAITGDRHAAEDLAQDAILKLLSTKSAIDFDRPLRPLLLTIVRRLALDHAAGRPRGALPLIEGDPEAPENSPDEFARRRERKKLLWEALEDLPPVWRAVLWLRDGLGDSYAQIAEILEITTDVVRTTLHRARRRLRAKLEAQMEDLS